MTAQVPAEFRELAERFADKAGEIARRYFRTPVAVDIKADNTPVSVADRSIEEMIRAELARAAPGHGIFGEEFGNERIDAEWVWVIDPIDGTKPFLTGRPTFGILIGLLHRGRPALGIIDQPIARERWLGVAGEGASFNGKPIRVRACPDIARAAFHANAPECFEGRFEERFKRLRKSVAFAQYSCDCYPYALLASGFVDLVVEIGLKPFDYVALVPVIEGAGGIVTDFEGRALDLSSDGKVIAAGDPAMHKAAREILGV